MSVSSKAYLRTVLFIFEILFPLLYLDNYILYGCLLRFKPLYDRRCFVILVNAIICHPFPQPKYYLPSPNYEMNINIYTDLSIFRISSIIMLCILEVRRLPIGDIMHVLEFSEIQYGHRRTQMHSTWTMYCINHVQESGIWSSCSPQGYLRRTKRSKPLRWFCQLLWSGLLSECISNEL